MFIININHFFIFVCIHVYVIKLILKKVLICMEIFILMSNYSLFSIFEMMNVLVGFCPPQERRYYARAAVLTADP